MNSRPINTRHKGQRRKGKPRPRESTGPSMGGNFPGSKYTAEQVDWLKACDRYRTRTGRRFLDAVAYLEVAREFSRKP